MSSPLYDIGNEVVIQGGVFSTLIGRRGTITKQKKIGIGMWLYDVVLHGDGFYVHDVPETDILITAYEEEVTEDAGPVCKCDISAGGCVCGRMAWEKERGIF